jgi:hypothetical protein
MRNESDTVRLLREADPVDRRSLRASSEEAKARAMRDRIVDEPPIVGPRSHRLRRPLALAVGIMAIAGLGAGARVLVQEPVDSNTVGCASTASLESNVAVLPLSGEREGMDPVTACREEWSSAFPDQAVPTHLVACVFPQGGLAVFPNPSDLPQSEACSSIGASVPSE